MAHSRHVHVVLIAAGLALSGCGAKPSAQNETAGSQGANDVGAAASEVDPCSLMTADEIAAITTDNVNVVKHWGEQACKYSSNPGDDGVTITVWAHDGVHRMEVMHNAVGLVGAMGESVAGKGVAGADTARILKPGEVAPPKLGDEAMWAPNTTLAVRKGTVYVDVSPPIMHDPANHPGYPLVPVEEKRKIAQTVAEKLLAKLGT